MATSFIPNSFQIPNALVDELMQTISPNALKCYLIIVRKTVGWNKEWDKISTTQLMKLSGIKRKETVYKAIQELEVLEVVESNKTLGKLTEYRLVLKNRTSTDETTKPVLKNRTTTSTKKPYSTKDTIKNNIQKQNLGDSINIEAYSEWIIHKNITNKGTTTKLINFLSKYTHKQQQEVVDTSIMNGWKGLFEPKIKPANNTKKRVAYEGLI